ncbi:MAG: glycoside hydrolase family 3 C-terminal domain-containing protein [Thermoflavifilum sp.]|nr:glycoside hydrolase family 3 C-terminal domain-containing protein [Thermoflavifilum sp.]
MTLEEEVQQLHTNFAPAIPRLGVQQYFYWNEAQHGVNALFGNLHHGGNQHQPPYGSPRATSFPVNFATAMTWDPELIYREAQAISDEARGFLDKSLFDVGQNNLGDSKDNYGSLTFWAPTINIDRDPRWGRTDEAFGEDPHLASIMAAAYVNGMQGQTMHGDPETGYLKVAATAKHYALNNLENNRTGISSNADDETIRDYYLATFKYLIEKAHVAGIMTAYNAINGTPAVANTYTINVLAKRTFGFDGYTTSDCGAVGTTYHPYPYGHFWAPPGWRIRDIDHKIVWINTQTHDTVSGAAGGQAFALRAGTCLNCTGAEYTMPNIEEAIRAGILSKGVIDRALTDIFTIRMRTGEFDPPDKVPYTRITKEAIESTAHQQLAEEVAENTLVLLKNDTPAQANHPLLPLDLAQLHRVVIVGDLANRVILGGYSGNPRHQVSPVEGITQVFKQKNPQIEVIFDSTATSTIAHQPAWLSEKTKTDIQQADLVIVYIGTDEAVSREGFDRANLMIPGNQSDLIYQVAQLGNPHMILVMQATGPMDISLIERYFPSIVFSGYNGEFQGTALAHVLAGDHNPSGHLNFTWYVNDFQLPDKSNYYLNPRNTDGLGRTYMYFTKTPQYPFGYGLSYTRFAYAHFTVSPTAASPDDSITVSFDVTNTGSLPGATVAQLYVAPPKVSGREMPAKQLKSFQKTHVLQPGETQHITLQIRGTQLSFWDEGKMRQVVYPGDYQFELGENARDIVDSAMVHISGDFTRHVAYVTLQPEALIYHVGDQINLKAKNKWLADDTDPNREQPHPEADHVLEIAYNDGTFADLQHIDVQYQSSNTKVAEVTKNGIVRFVGPGVVTITATAQGVSGSTVFVVK